MISGPMIERFKESVESVAGHCVVTTDVTDTLNQILADLNAKRIATSENAPNAHEIFGFEVGISSAQAGIAETGTLVRDSNHAAAHHATADAASVAALAMRVAVISDIHANLHAPRSI